MVGGDAECRTAYTALIGLPGSGKSTLGRHLARRLGGVFIDSDHVIEARLGCTIRTFFEREGEERFRDIEQTTLDELTLGNNPAVLATGGGAVLRATNRMHLRERTYVVYLHCQPENIYRRLRHDKIRPLLQVADPLERLRDLYAQRDPLYRETAHFVMDMDRHSPSLAINKIAMQVELAGVIFQPHS